ncbi:MAG: YihY/virulence factor BrkB family protein [Actinomycetes bacterium]
MRPGAGGIRDLARDVQRRLAAGNGSNLAAAIAFRGYLALFAILVLAVALAGFFDASGRDVADWIVGTLGLSGDAARAVSRAVGRAQSSRAATTVVGLAGLVWTGTGVAAAISAAWNAAWSIPGGGLRGRARGLLWMLASGAFIVIAVSTTGVVAVRDLHWSVAIVAGLLSDLALVLITASTLPARRIPVRAMLPGALVGAVGLTAARVLGAVVLTRLVLNSSAIYGSIGTFFALLVWMLVIGYILVIAAFVEVAVWSRTHGTHTVEVEVPATD